MLYLSYTLETCTHNILYINVLFIIIKSTKRDWNLTFAFFFCRFKDIKYDDKGLIAAVAQDQATKEVLMLAWMNEEALQRTLTTGEAHYWSRSRQELWHKGATSGHWHKSA